MEFCDICNNMIYIKTEQGDAGPALVRHCRFCGFEQKDAAVSGHCICIARTNYSEDELLYTFHQNEFLRFDPALPRVREPTLRCPKACEGSAKDARFIYIKYHPVDMKYFYACDHCGESFRLGDAAGKSAAPLPPLGAALPTIAEESAAPVVAPAEPAAPTVAPKRAAPKRKSAAAAVASKK